MFFARATLIAFVFFRVFCLSVVLVCLPVQVINLEIFISEMTCNVFN